MKIVRADFKAVGPDSRASATLTVERRRGFLRRRTTLEQFDVFRDECGLWYDRDTGRMLVREEQVLEHLYATFTQTHGDSDE